MSCTINAETTGSYGCGWSPIAPWGNVENICCPDSGLSDEELAVLLPRAHQAASEFVNSLTGNQFGFYLDRFLPCARGCNACGYDPCNCCFMDRLILPKGPVCGVCRYMVGGVSQPTNSITILHESGCWQAVNCEPWPSEQCQGAGYFNAECCEDDGLGCDPSNNWWIEYMYGTPVPVLGQMAVEQLACQFIYSCSNTAKCSLPDGVTSVNRQGIGFSVETDATTVFQAGLSGIPAVDRFVLAVNPKGLCADAEFLSPDNCQPFSRAVSC